MIVEHTFITTLDRDDALLLADGLLTELGFVAGKQGPGEWAAGKAGANRLSKIRRVVRIEYDRGRISFAASAITSAKQQEQFYQTYLLALADAAEGHVSRGVPAEAAAKPVHAAMSVITKKERRAWILVFVILGVLGLILVGSIVVAAVFGP